MELLPPALDRDTFSISKTRLEDEQISQIGLLVDQTNTTSISHSDQFLSQPNTRTLAIVDRTANIDLAAREIVTARLPPYNTSPYTPDLVIVNNFVIEYFVDACLKYADSVVSSGVKSASNGDWQKLEKDLDDKAQPKIYTSKNPNLKVLVLQDR